MTASSDLKSTPIRLWLARRIIEEQSNIAELGRSLGVTRSCVSNWYAGTSRIPARFLRGLGRLFGEDPVTLAELYIESYEPDIAEILLPALREARKETAALN
ncbi:hypothetical protein [Sutterella sp.]|uniref:hypothetical protein n=1 Tax=Sutterella sp. TaxID=1981025 RepID=UPI0026DEB1F1|nr:hypothetical protein [Sutterella sp.]MDO5531660.1 hypothetical protein [Sutterella sp.]